MLVASARNGWDLEEYALPDHPLQSRIRAAVLELAGAEDAPTGVDGCGLPVYALSLTELATMFARLARPPNESSLGHELGRASEAMLAEPYLVGGRGRVATAVMRACPRILVKGGAEGLMCAGALREGLGISVKVRDGAARAAGPALLHALQLMGVLEERDLEALRNEAEPTVLGGSEPVGRIVPDFSLTTR
jgi:L-asparaginase II